jgi:hypothetical protein
VARSYERKRENDGPVVAWDLPPQRYEVGREDNHHRKHEEADGEREPETAQDSRDLDEKVGLLDLLFGRAPCDVKREEVRKESLGQVKGQATKEEEAVCVARGYS